METFWAKLGRLLSVKSIVTIMTTVVFSVLSVQGKISGQEFLTIFSVIIAFYFGTQSQKNADTTDSNKQTKE
jgi:hypothetical protein